MLFRKSKPRKQTLSRKNLFIALSLQSGGACYNSSLLFVLAHMERSRTSFSTVRYTDGSLPQHEAITFSKPNAANASLLFFLYVFPFQPRMRRCIQSLQQHLQSSELQLSYLLYSKVAVCIYVLYTSIVPNLKLQSRTI